MNFIVPEDLRPDINAYLNGWYEKSKARQQAKGKTFLLSYAEYLNLWGKRRIRSLEKWMDDGSLYARQRRHTKDKPNPNGYVLSPVSFAASQEKTLTADNMMICTRGTALQNCKMKKGDRHSPKSCEQISAKTRGVAKSDEHRANISRAMTGMVRGAMCDQGKADRAAAMKAYWAAKRDAQAGSA